MYFITTFCLHPDKGMGTRYSRCFGYYLTQGEADEALKENRCNMHECLYDYGVIERIEPGIHPDADERWFYKYDSEADSFVPCEEPEELKHICNLSIG